MSRSVLTCLGLVSVFACLEVTTAEAQYTHVDAYPGFSAPEITLFEL